MPIFCGMAQKGQWWFRVLGVGLSWKDTRIHPLVFSERNGYRKGLRIGSWQFYFLPLVPAARLTPRAGGQRALPAKPGLSTPEELPATEQGSASARRR